MTSLDKRIEYAAGNAVILAVLGQVPPFTFLPEEAISVPLGVGAGLLGIDLAGPIKRGLR